MHLIGIQIQAPDGSVAGDARGLRGLIRAWFRQEVPQGSVSRKSYLGMGILSRNGGPRNGEWVINEDYGKQNWEQRQKTVVKNAVGGDILRRR